MRSGVSAGEHSVKLQIAALKGSASRRDGREAITDGDSSGARGVPAVLLYCSAHDVRRAVAVAVAVQCSGRRGEFSSEAEIELLRRAAPQWNRMHGHAARARQS